MLLTDRVRFDRVARVLRCNNCTLVYLDQDSFQFPKDFYQHEYHQTYLTHVDPDMLNPARHYRKNVGRVRTMDRASRASC